MEIGQHVWIANGCTISTGAIIPPYSIIAASSLVNKDFSNISTKGNFFAGIPANLKRTGTFRVYGSLEGELHKHFSEIDSLVYKCPKALEIGNYI